MAPRLWNNSYSIGVGSIDQQHMRLFELIDDIYAKIGKVDNAKLMAAVVGELVSYTEEHFTHEERMMRRCGYAGLAEHRLLHKGFVDKVADLRQRVDEGKLVLTFEVTSFLKSWLVEHIQKVDRQYLECFQRHGIK